MVANQDIDSVCWKEHWGNWYRYPTSLKKLAERLVIIEILSQERIGKEVRNMACSKSCRVTGRSAAKAASKVLRGNYSAAAKKAAGSALSQRKSCKK